ncbi:mitochondrial 50S ribosomal protein L28-like protein [Lactifluus volemus]|nr:mitochondrial 50S ribosomal protein L28-like protein [Lactifluus volemus]
MHPSLPSFVAALSQPFKRSQLGLFHGKMKQYGNNVPFSKKKTRRTWLPNIQSKRLFSDALGEMVRVKVTTHALKTIRKVGGLDQYVLNTKSDLLGWEGMRLRVAVREAQERKVFSSPSGAHPHAPL